MSAVAFDNSIYDQLMEGPEAMIELFHGYTYLATSSMRSRQLPWMYTRKKVCLIEQKKWNPLSKAIRLLRA